jgi:hypothetical protein
MKNKNNVAAKARKAGIPKGTVYARLRGGWSLKKALSTPVINRHRPKKVETPVPEKPRKVSVPVPPVPKNNPMFVEKYSSEKPSKLVIWGLGAVVILLVAITIGG